MDYFIITVKTKVQTTCGEVTHIGFVCANSLTRCKNDKGEDILTCVSSGYASTIPMSSVICITAATPTPDQISALRG